MTWLFTQVWLWSLAAFAAGVAATWLLFVRPAHQRLRELRDHSSAEGDIPLWDSESVPDSEFHRYSEFERAAATTRDTAVQPVPENGTVRDRVPESDGETTARHPEPPDASTPSDAGAVERPTEHVPRPLGNQRARWMEAASEDFGGSVFAAEPGVEGARTSEPDEWQPVQETPHGSDTTSFDESELRLERERELREEHPRRQPPESAPAPGGTGWPATPTAPAEVGTGAEFSAPAGDHTWFSAAEFDMYDTDNVASESAPGRFGGGGSERPGSGSEPGEPHRGAAAGGHSGEPSEGELTGRLRSLFEPMVTPGIDPDRSGAELPDSSASPVTDSAGAAPNPGETTGGTAPAVGADPAGPTDSASGSTSGVEETPEGLPRRVPGANARRGGPAANAHSVLSGNVLGNPASGRPSDDTAGDSDAAAGHEPQEWYPDERYPEQPRPDESYTVKGQFGSRQYHTAESPYFDRVVAEVWFRGPADAEQAGFVAWDGRSRS
ncbi:hypothetical protein SAMN04487820_102158 [Actinopolyspora mzabensis]|uniref:Uncharacterized protein n=1 Tax=Actinopolyspora mzabensis TaxID=995066 RepID=A0A1G8WPE6_ACTMZ|nr:hypothetical protein [Actinopolyspora mzabensis]SDJ80154.1 hypothetical protein SAMN04487820_102158 [Actinopolyspora mzabensis]